MNIDDDDGARAWLTLVQGDKGVVLRGVKFVDGAYERFGYIVLL